MKSLSLPNNLEFKTAKPDDLKMLCTLSVQTFRDAFYHLNNPEDIELYISKAFSSSQLKLELSLEQCDFVFLLQNNDPIAYYKTNLCPHQSDLNDPETLEIERIYVCKEHQNNRYGQLMLDYIILQAKLNPAIQSIWLGVWDQNKAAIRFYERNGFKIFSSHPFLLGNDPQTDLLMRLNLY